MDLPDIEETNELMCVVLRKDGTIDKTPNGKIGKGDKLPQNGDGYVVGSVRCTVAGHAYTPLLPYTWTLLLVENQHH